jgi:hypothetical protein
MVEASPTAEATLREAAEILTRGVADPDWVEKLEPELLQKFLGAIVTLYAGKVDLTSWVAPFAEDGTANVPTASEVCFTAVQMLDAASVEVFELAMWKSWAPDRHSGDEDVSQRSEKQP